MKSINLSLAAIAAMSMFSIANATSLSEALKSGKVSGDISVTYEKRSQDKELPKYYSDTEYSVGSIGLAYETAKFNNFSAVMGVRAYKVLFEDDKNFDSGKGKGDSSERFYEDGKNQTVELEKAYLAYDLDNLHIKAGRQFISTEWINKNQDAIRLDAKVLTNTDVEFIWTARQGRTFARDYSPMTDINTENENAGLYKLGLTQTFSDSLSAKAYALTAPSLKDIYGGKVTFKNDSFSTMVHYAQTNEDVKNTLDGDILELKASTTFAGVSATLGYIQTDKKAGFEAVAGETINPFEEGDQIYLEDAKTTYLMLSKSLSDVSFTALYGITEYGSLEKSEFNLWAAYPVSKNLSFNLGYAMTDEDSKDSNYTDLQQLNTTLSYNF